MPRACVCICVFSAARATSGSRSATGSFDSCAIRCDGSNSTRRPTTADVTITPRPNAWPRCMGPPRPGEKHASCRRRASRAARSARNVCARGLLAHRMQRRCGMDDPFGDLWWMLVMRGLAGILFGIFAVVWPLLTLEVLLAVFAVYAIADGLVAVAAGLIRV